MESTPRANTVQLLHLPTGLPKSPSSTFNMGAGYSLGGFVIDWFTFQPYESARIYPSDSEDELTVHRHAEYHKTLELAAPLTLRALLSAMGNFYQHPLTPEEIEEVRDRVPEAMFGYKGQLLEEAARGKEVHWCDLLGSKPAPRGEGILFCSSGPDRHPLSCHGLVRFEGLGRLGRGKYKIILGS